MALGMVNASELPRGEGAGAVDTTNANGLEAAEQELLRTNEMHSS